MTFQCVFVFYFLQTPDNWFSEVLLLEFLGFAVCADGLIIETYVR